MKLKIKTTKGIEIEFEGSIKDFNKLGLNLQWDEEIHE